MNAVVYTRVAGVTFEGRQIIISKLTGYEACRLEPEPENQYDPNALAVKVSMGGVVYHIGYVPKELAAQIAPHLDGENLLISIEQITGGFALVGGDVAAYGVQLRIEVPITGDNPF